MHDKRNQVSQVRISNLSDFTVFTVQGLLGKGVLLTVLFFFFQLSNVPLCCEIPFLSSTGRKISQFHTGTLGRVVTALCLHCNSEALSTCFSQMPLVKYNQKSNRSLWTVVLSWQPGREAAWVEPQSKAAAMYAVMVCISRQQISGLQSRLDPFDPWDEGEAVLPKAQCNLRRKTHFLNYYLLHTIVVIWSSPEDLMLMELPHILDWWARDTAVA